MENKIYKVNIHLSNGSEVILTDVEANRPEEAFNNRIDIITDEYIELFDYRGTHCRIYRKHIVSIDTRETSSNVAGVNKKNGWLV